VWLMCKLYRVVLQVMNRREIKKSSILFYSTSSGTQHFTVCVSPWFSLQCTPFLAMVLFSTKIPSSSSENGVRVSGSTPVPMWMKYVTVLAKEKMFELKEAKPTIHTVYVLHYSLFSDKKDSQQYTVSPQHQSNIYVI
jgi:hypothetical protein